MQSFNDRELQIQTMSEILNIPIKKTQKDIDYFFDEIFRTLDSSKDAGIVSIIYYVDGNKNIYFEYQIQLGILYYNPVVKKIFEPFNFKDKKIHKIIIRYMNKYFKVSRISSVRFNPPF